LYPVLVHRLALLLHASFRPRLAAVALAFSLALHLHQVGQRTFTSKLLSMFSSLRVKVPAQPDGGEGLEIWKGYRREAGSERSV